MYQKKLTKLAIKRKEKGFSQWDLAMKAKISTATIQSFESRRNNINHAKIYIVRALAKALDCELEDLLD